MSHYERVYGTRWTDLGKDEAIERAYALGVAASLEEYHPDELDRLRRAMDSAYNKSVVDLAFEEGKNEARSLDPDERPDEIVWEALVEAGEVDIPEGPDDELTGGRLGLPSTLERLGALERPDIDDRGAQRRPDFLERD